MNAVLVIKPAESVTITVTKVSPTVSITGVMLSDRDPSLPPTAMPSFCTTSASDELAVITRFDSGV